MPRTNDNKFILKLRCQYRLDTNLDVSPSSSKVVCVLDVSGSEVNKAVNTSSEPIATPFGFTSAAETWPVTWRVVVSALVSTFVGTESTQESGSARFTALNSVLDIMLEVTEQTDGSDNRIGVIEETVTWDGASRVTSSWRSTEGSNTELGLSWVHLGVKGCSTTTEGVTDNVLCFTWDGGSDLRFELLHVFVGTLVEFISSVASGFAVTTAVLTATTSPPARAGLRA